MHKQDIIDLVGQANYARQCEVARTAAPYALLLKVPVGYDTVLATDIADLIWDADEPGHNDHAKVKLILDMYRDMPCYALLESVALRYDDLSTGVQEEFWSQVRALLTAEDDALALPAAYMVAVDFLDNMEEQSRLIWNRFLDGDRSINTISRLLRAAGIEH